MARKTVSIIYTGGTFGMRPSSRGYAPGRDLEGLIRARLADNMAVVLSISCS